MSAPVAIIATRNPDKISRVGNLLSACIRVEPLPGDVTLAEPEMRPSDDVEAIRRTAVAKAIAASSVLPDSLVIATDGGLLFPALATWLPARTHRFAGPDATDDDRVNALLAMAHDLRADERAIVWYESIALARSGRVIATIGAMSAPAQLRTEARPGAGRGDRFWIPRLWGMDDQAGAEPDHWRRLALALPALVRGVLAVR